MNLAKLVAAGALAGILPMHSLADDLLCFALCFGGTGESLLSGQWLKHLRCSRNIGSL